MRREGEDNEGLHSLLQGQRGLPAGYWTIKLVSIFFIYLLYIYIYIYKRKRKEYSVNMTFANTRNAIGSAVHDIYIILFVS